MNQDNALQQALAQPLPPDPLQQLKALRQQQLDRCAVKCSVEIEQLLQQAQHDPR